jgi:cyclic beta-1,2-glucan synthetase
MQHPLLCESQTLGNGRYRTFLTTAGGGYSSWVNLALTRWNADPVEAGDGFFIYLRDSDSGVFWSIGQIPVLKAPTAYHSRLTTDSAEWLRHDDGIDARLEVWVPANDDLELRRVTLRNRSTHRRRLELTSYAEIVLNDPAADAAHPAFSKLFIQTEWLEAQRALLARRRPRASGEPPCWLIHALIATDPALPAPQYETNRTRFIGRGHTLAAPQALVGTDPLSSTVGNVLDPIVSLRHCLELAPGEEAQLTFLLGAATDREAALTLAARYATPSAIAASHPTGATQQPALDLALIAPDLGSDGSAPTNAALTTTDDQSADLNTALATDEVFQFWNGYGGFSSDGREYVIRIHPDANGRPQLPPLPWTNVIANPQFGFIASETGAGYTWSQNSRENRLTPWYNDPVLDPHGEALYLRDEENGAVWSLQPGPMPQAVTYEVRHGFGYSRYRHHSHALEQEVYLFVPRADPVKLALIRISNRSDRPRQLSLFAYTRLVLGVLPTDSAATLTVSQDAVTGALLTENRNREFSGRIAFAAGLETDPPLQVCADRLAFLGHHGNPSRPAALLQDKTLNGRLGSGLDPCFALQASLQLEPGGELEYLFLLGEADDQAHACRLVTHYRAAGVAAETLKAVQNHWQNWLAGVQIQTPAPALDLMINGWLPYQILSCRLWGRSAFYQSGGAFGFRDQLQDAAALLYHDPQLTRQQLLLNAAHQFQEGDVLHWWHPPTSCGIRTRFSDDLLWLPWLATFYARTTGDWGLFNEVVPFLKAPHLQPNQDEAFLVPETSAESASLYEHCCRALDRSLTQGTHGLPLMGTGDWNDGMNRVGREGRGESVWMGFFLYTILGDFIPVCGQHADHNRARRYAAFRSHLATALNEHGWDGEWYRRAWYDNGAVLGSKDSDECQIDALAQAWAVISKVAPWERAQAALEAVERHLISEAEGLIRLLTPPFVDTPHDPGYIKGYVAGVRENGGQYTHAALWVVQAMAELGHQDRALQLLDMLNPINHALTPEQVAIYQVEPFVIAADVYGTAPHIGRGGWTWYTGSAGWMVRVTLESILGLKPLGGHTLQLQPRIPHHWPGFQLRYRLPDNTTIYAIEIKNPDRNANQVTAIQLDDRPGTLHQGVASIPMLSDGAIHQVMVKLGA